MNGLKVIFVLIALSLTGCATSISSQDRAALRRVYIAPLRLPEVPMFYVEPSTWLVSRGDVANDTRTAQAITYACALEKYDIDVAARVQRELESQLSEKGIQIVDSAEEADATLELYLVRWGIAPAYASTRSIPHFWAKFRLIRKSGGVIWRDYPPVKMAEEIAKEIKPYPFSDYLNDPQLLDSQISDVNRLVIRRVLSTL